LTPEEKVLAIQTMAQTLDLLRAAPPATVHAVWYAAMCALLDLGVEPGFLADAIHFEAKATADEARRREAVASFH
jgi:hypothetical protein